MTEPKIPVAINATTTPVAWAMTVELHALRLSLNECSLPFVYAGAVNARLETLGALCNDVARLESVHKFRVSLRKINGVNYATADDLAKAFESAGGSFEVIEHGP